MNTMTVEQRAELADRIRARGFNWRRAFVQGDGTLQLDPTHRYEPVGELDHGFTAYQRVCP